MARQISLSSSSSSGSYLTKIDPVQGLINYVLDNKPYHTKVIEVLVEYVHTDLIATTVLENIDWCIGIGSPTLSNKFAFTITQADPTNKTFTIQGDARYRISVGQRVIVDKSTTNNGYYYVTSISYNTTTGTTTVGVTGNILTNTADGYIIGSKIQFCPQSSYTGLYTSPADAAACAGGWGDTYDGVIYLVYVFDTTNNAIVIEGNHLTYFNNITTATLYDTSDNKIAAYNIEAVNLTSGNTSVVVTQPVTALTGSYYLFVKYLGFDDVAFCSVVEEGFVGVNVTESMVMDITTDETDIIETYNLENDLNVGFGNNFSGGIDAPFSQTDNTYYFTSQNITTDVAVNSFTLYGGNFVSHFIYERPAISGYDAVGLVGTYNIDQYVIVDINGPSANTFSISGNHTNVFTVGIKFYVRRPSENSGWFTVTSSSYDGVNTNVVVSETVADAIYNGLKDVRYFGSIPAAVYNETTFSTTLIPIETVSSSVTYLEYQWINPQIELNVLQTDTSSVSLLDSINLSGELVESPVIFDITAVSTANNTFTIAGATNASYFGAGSTLYVVDSYNNVNDGAWTVKSVTADTLNDLTILTVEQTITNSTLPYGRIVVSNRQVGLQARTEIIETLNFGWGNILTWFQYLIMLADSSTNTLTVAGNASSDIQVGQVIRIQNSASNDGFYTVQTVTVTSGGDYTDIVVSPGLSATDSTGYIEPEDELGIDLTFSDIVASTVIEGIGESVVTDSSIVDSWDLNAWDVGDYDENIETISSNTPGLGI